LETKQSKSIGRTGNIREQLTGKKQTRKGRINNPKLRLKGEVGG